MQYHSTADNLAYSRYTTEELRSKFLLSGLFEPGQVNLNYTDVDRAIVGGVMPAKTPLTLPEDKSMLGADYFTERREIGIINIGDAGRITADDETFEVNQRDSLYIGKGTKSITFESINAETPARFFLTSYPAHHAYPTKLINKSEANRLEMGSPETSNERVIYQSIVPGIVDTCQVVMGFTELLNGSNWNTYPPHTHRRRMEIYAYFDMSEDQAVFHLMGAPNETRHIVTRDGEAVVSPSWSIHSGVGTGSYSFVWAMGGENQIFDDMDHVKLTEIV